VKLSLNRILWLMVALILLFSAVIGIAVSMQLRQNLRSEIETKVTFEAIQLGDFFEATFEKIHNFFNNSSELDRIKLYKVRDYFETMDKNIQPIYEEINRFRLFGNYDIFLIDKNRVVRRATLAMDIGLDFHNYPFAMKVFDMLDKGGLPYHRSQPMYMPLTNDFRCYFLTRSKHGDFYVQISHNYKPGRDFGLWMERMRGKDPHIRLLNLYFLSNGLLIPIGDRQSFKNKKNYFKRLNEREGEFLKRYVREMGLPLNPDRLMKEPMKIHDLFSRRKVQYRIDGKKRIAIVYVAADNIFNDPLNRETILLRMEYDLSGFYADYHESLRRVMVLLALATLILLLMIYTIKLLLVDRIRKIVTALKHDEEIHPGSPEIEEFRQLAMAIDGYRKKLAKQNRELEILTFIDPLTGAYNRRYFSKMLEEMIYEYARYQKKFALLIFDVDNFKSINDSFGHDVGDEVLVELSRHVLNHIRKSDHFFRIGGEEFAILMSPVDSLEDVVKKAESLRKSIAEKRFGPDLKVTISAGVSIFNDDDDSVSLFKRVDGYLYRSKKRGKNITTSDLTAGNLLSPYC